MRIIGIQEAHDCSAALLIDGKIIAACQEERFRGLKGEYGYPKNAVDYCLRQGGIKAADLDIVALASHNWNPVLTKIKRNMNFSVSNWVEEQHKFWKYKLGLVKNFYCCANCRETNLGICDSCSALLNRNKNYYDLFKDREDFIYDDFYDIPERLLSTYHEKATMDEMKDIRRFNIAEELGIDPEKIQFVTHEDCHTAYAYYGGKLNGEDVICLTAEGIGDYSNATFSLIIDGVKNEIASSTECHLGHIYQYITLLLGMKPAQHEYKVMGLAPYASEYEVEKSYKVFKDILKIEGLVPVYDQKPKDLYFHFREALEGHRFDGIAGALQRWTENILSDWLYAIFDKFDVGIGLGELRKIRKVIFSGGVAQNVKACMEMANTYWCRLPAVTDFVVLPASGDVSISIGACYSANSSIGEGDNKEISNFYLGPDADTKETEDRFINLFVNKKTHSVSDDRYFYRRKGVASGDWNSNYIARLLSEGKIIARCSGRMEFGHRALGNRSILADPRNYQNIRRLNQAIKNRDFWMPFAPVILRERAKDYLVYPEAKVEDRFMTMAFDTTELAQKEIPAAIHPADFTCRPQVIDREDNPEYYDIVSAFQSITGVGALLNTSFNLHGEPICLGAKEALRVFENSDLDGIILGEYLLLKRGNNNKY